MFIMCKINYANIFCGLSTTYVLLKRNTSRRPINKNFFINSRKFYQLSYLVVCVERQHLGERVATQLVRLVRRQDVELWRKLMKLRIHTFPKQSTLNYRSFFILFPSYPGHPVECQGPLLVWRRRARH